MKDIVIAGIAGSGKGTQARALRGHLWSQVQYFEPGSVYRALASNDNIAGNYTKAYTNKGLLVPDGFTQSLIWLVFSCLEPNNTLLVDGFPRMYSQKKMFDTAMSNAQRDFLVFELVISEQEAMTRLANRMLCPSCGTTYSSLLHGDITTCPDDGATLQIRDDDRSSEAIQERFKLFYQDTKPGLDEYATEGKLIQIDGTQSIEAITQEIIQHIS